MTSDYPGTVCTPRDFQILHALGRSPFATEQLLKLSTTFTQPFATARVLRRRMQALASAGWVHCFQYASASRGAQNYYKLTPTGYRLLNGPDAPLPAEGFFRPVSLGLQQHTRGLADFIVHALVSAHEVGASVLTFYRENQLRLSLGDESLLPDATFQLRTDEPLPFNFCVELDNGSEPICSQKERDSWERKISFYDRYQDVCRYRFRVLVVTTRNARRHISILHAIARLLRNPFRRLFYAVPLNEFLAAENAILAPCFLDHWGFAQSMIPSSRQPSPASFHPRTLDPALALW